MMAGMDEPDPVDIPSELVPVLRMTVFDVDEERLLTKIDHLVHLTAGEAGVVFLAGIRGFLRRALECGVEPDSLLRVVTMMTRDVCVDNTSSGNEDQDG